MATHGVSSLKAALARTEATLAATSSNRFHPSSTHDSSVAPTSPRVSKLMQENGITLQGRPIVPAGLPEFRSDHMAEEKHEQDASTIRDLSARVKELEEHKRQQAELNERQATTIDLLRRQLRENDTRHLDEIRHLRSELAGAKSQAETTADELKKTQDDLVSTLRRAEEAEELEKLRDNDTTDLLRTIQVEQQRRAELEQSLRLAKQKADKYFGRLTVALQQQWALEEELQGERRVGRRDAAKDEALRSTYEVSKSAAAGQQCAALHQLISTQSHKLRLYEAELQDKTIELDGCRNRVVELERSSKREREVLVEAERQNHIVVAERDIASKAIEDIKQELVQPLEERVKELGELLLQQTAALEELQLDNEGLQGELGEKRQQILEHEAAMQKATALQRQIMNSRWFHLFGKLDGDLHAQIQMEAAR